MHYLYFGGGVLIGLVLIIYSTQLVNTFGHLSWAERYLGAGMSYFAWKLIGVAFIVAGLMALRY